MLDEMIPALKPLNKTKKLAAESSLTASLPVVDSKISFQTFVSYLKNKLPEVSETKERLYSYLIKKFENEPSLLQQVDDIDAIGNQAELMDLLATSLFPVVGDHEKNNFALASPYQFSVFYYSDNFRKLFFDNNEQHLLLPDGVPSEQLKAIHCAMIYDHVMEKFYGVKLNENPELIYPVCDTDSGMLRYYRIRLDRRFIDLRLKGKLPPIQDCGVCLNTFRILDLEKQLAKIPLDLFEAEGFAVWVAEDVTQIESLELIKKVLLREDDCDTGAIDDLKKAVKALVGLSDVEVGLMPFIKVNNQFVLDEESVRHGLVARQWLGDDPENSAQFHRYIGFLSEHPEPTAISNLSKEMLSFAPFFSNVFQAGARSFISYPMQNSDGLIGMLELSSPTQNALTHKTVAQLEPAIPLLSLAMLKCRDSFHGKIEKVIREKFTALQQPVEWKFTEVAWEHLRSNGNANITKNVVFENVYPLYGAIDIRNSSQERSHALQKDLKEHLSLIAATLEKLQSIIQLPLLEGLEFKNDNFRQLIETHMTADDETQIKEFLNNEAEPVFIHLQKNNKEAEAIVDEYFHIVRDSESQLYRSRREYEETLSQINDTVLAYMEKEQAALQNSYPHYFEKYRTDGIEYNIYIGQSISPTTPFDLLYLKNMRLWQLKSMAEAARITNRLISELKIPLQTTQLILAHSQSISISFRRDERKFDVEGSYNIRYEVIKKRLDKVRIKETGERLTQPGKIALVYSNQKEVQEYEEYIKFLQKKNILNPGIEFLELEDLQGVKGMKAIRVEINMQE
jgi:hypothetical protein